MQIRRLLFFTILFSAAAVAAFSQSATVIDDEDLQSWNDIQLTVAMAKKVDFVTKASLRFGRNITTLVDGRYQVGFAFKTFGRFTIAPSYTFVRARNTSGHFRTEHRPTLSATYRFPIKQFGLSHRSTIERRLRRPADIWRYRALLAFEKNLPANVLRDAKFFIGNEVFYDNVTHKFYRNRFNAGVTKTLSGNLSLDIYYLRQNDSFSRPGDLHVIGTTWKFRTQ